METAVYFENIVRNFSRYNKYNPGAEMRTKSRDIVKIIFKANSSREKLPVLHELREQVEELKVLIRISYNSITNQGGSRMQKNIRLMLVVAIVAAFMTVGLFLPGLVGAGDLDPPPDAVDGNGYPVPTMRTLDEIYNVTDCIDAPVAQTGQESSYVPGDDGFYEMGVAWPVPRFTDNGDGTVTDNLTGLIWLQNANCPNTARNWPTALSVVAELNTDGTMNDNDCGDTSNGESHQTDWRLPNIKELQSLIDFGNYVPALPSGHLFSGVRSTGDYWSSTSRALSGVTSAWFVDMYYGQVDLTSKTGPANNKYVWPVRGGN